MSGSTIYSVGDWPTNADLIADCKRLGYFDADGKGTPGTVLDATYGDGKFWSVWRPEHLTTSDLYKAADIRADFRDLPFPDRAFDAVVFDPPYKLNGTPAMGEMDDRYGTDRRTSRDDVMDAIADGAAECWRVARRWLLVKVMDQVEGGQMRWQTDLVTERLGAICQCGEGPHYRLSDQHRDRSTGLCATFKASARKVTRMDFLNHGIPQPKDQTCRVCSGSGCGECNGTGRVPRVQRTPANRYSQLLVFRRLGR